jgi:hypothetical protein
MAIADKRPIYVCAPTILRVNQLLKENDLKMSDCKIVPCKQPYRNYALMGVVAHREQFLGDFTEAEIKMCSVSVEE